MLNIPHNQTLDQIPMRHYILSITYSSLEAKDAFQSKERQSESAPSTKQPPK